MKIAIFSISLILVLTIKLSAQSIGPGTLNATGHTAIMGGNEFDWSIGEMTMINTFSSASIIVTQGVLQPNELIPEGVDNISVLSKLIQVFPNPAIALVNLQYSSQVTGTLSYQLLDFTGKVIRRQTINVMQGTTIEEVNVSDLACATYILEVTINSANTALESISYKIQKLQ